MATIDARFIQGLVVTDPGTSLPVEVEIWKDPESGGIFGPDASFVERVVPEDGRNGVDVDNSTEGPVGYCARVRAFSPPAALRLLCQALPDRHLVIDGSLEAGEKGVEYLEVLFNQRAVALDAIDEENAADVDRADEADTAEAVQAMTSGERRDEGRLVAHVEAIQP